ncbi:hypothetical protein FRC15_007990, partial [Serendipita sp. 397]
SEESAYETQQEGERVGRHNYWMARRKEEGEEKKSADEESLRTDDDVFFIVPRDSKMGMEKRIVHQHTNGVN